MTKYAHLEAVEDLGLDYPPQDDTDDLVGANENAPDRELGGDRSEATNTNPLRRTDARPR